MQFSTVTIIAAAVASVNAATSTVVESSEVLVTITSCGPEVTDCPAKVYTSVVVGNYSTPANVTTWENGANKLAVGAAALAAGALLAL